MPAPAGTVSGIAPAVVPIDRQAVRHGLGEGHAVALEARRQHEQIGRRRRARRGDRPRPCAEHVDALGETVAQRCRRRAAPPPCGSRRAIAGDGEPPRQARYSVQAPRSARRSPCAARSRRPTEAARCRRCCRARARRDRCRAGDGDDLGRNVVVVGQQRRGRRAGHDDAARAGERRALALAAAPRRRRAPGRFRAPADDAPARPADCARAAPARPPAARRRRARRPRSAVFRHRGELVARRRLGLGARPRKAVAETDHVDLPAEPLQFGDDAAVIGVAAGRRRKIARHRERDASHHNGAS